MSETVLVDLPWTYGVNVNGQIAYYGPGVVPVPADVARRMGWDVVAEIAPDAGRPETAVTSPGLEDIDGVGGDLASSLTSHGFASVEAVAHASVDALTAVPGIGARTAPKLIAAAAALIGD